MIKYERVYPNEDNITIADFIEANKYLLDNPATVEGKELNAVIKPWENEDGTNPYSMRMVITVPSEYHAGVSNMGMNIIYNLLNDFEDVLCDRGFLPEKKLLRMLEKNNLSLGYGIQNKKPFMAYDVVAFSSYFENQFIPMIKLMHGSGIPVYSQERDESYPIVLLGGVSAYSPSPIDQLVDVIFIGDGEIQLPIFKALHEEYKAGSVTKEQFLVNCAKYIPGTYVPQLYEYSYKTDDNGNPTRFIKSIDVKDKYKTDAPLPVMKAILDLSTSVPFYKSILPATESNQIGYTSVETARGCHSSCRFCMVGHVHKPYREHTVDKIVATMREAVGYLGSKSFTPYSLNYSAYSQQGELAERLIGDLRKSVTTASQRVDSFCPDVAQLLAEKANTRAATVAIEAGSQRMRNVINKEVWDIDIRNAICSYIESGYQMLKVYMISNLPFETEADRMEIINILRPFNDYKNYIETVVQDIDNRRITEQEGLSRIETYKKMNFFDVQFDIMITHIQDVINYVENSLRNGTIEEFLQVASNNPFANDKMKFAEWFIVNHKSVTEEDLSTKESLLKYLHEQVKVLEGAAEKLQDKIINEDVNPVKAFDAFDKLIEKLLGKFLLDLDILKPKLTYDNIKRGYRMEIRISYTEFTAKMFTPLQYADVSDWSEKLEKVYPELSKINVKYRRSTSGINHLVLQLLNRADPRFNDVLVDAVINHGIMFSEAMEGPKMNDDDINDLLFDLVKKHVGVDAIEFLKEIPTDAILPWDVLSVGFNKDYLADEYEKARNAAITPSCYKQCIACGVCQDEKLIEMGARKPFYHRMQYDIDREDMFNSIRSMSKESTVNKIVVMLDIPVEQRDFPPSKFKIALKAAFSSIGISVRERVEMLSEQTQWDNWVHGLDIAVLRTTKPIGGISSKQIEKLNIRLGGLIKVKSVKVYDSNAVKGLKSLGEKVLYYTKMIIPEEVDIESLNKNEEWVSYRQKQRTDLTGRIAYADKESIVTVKVKPIIEDERFYEIYIVADTDVNPYELLRWMMNIRNKREVLKWFIERVQFFTKPKVKSLLVRNCSCGEVREVDIFGKPIGKHCLKCEVEGRTLETKLREQVELV